jgi:predicted transposase/invertase (TIGR01784 family)
MEYEESSVKNNNDSLENRIGHGIEEAISKGIEEGIKRGMKEVEEYSVKQRIEEETKVVAKKMKEKGFDLKTISDITGLSEVEINLL